MISTCHQRIITHPPTALQPDGVTTGSQRATLCISSQVGCQMGCTFCATGTMGLRGMLLRVPLCIRVMSTAVLKGDLLGGEIVEQLVHARRIMPVRNVVFMVRMLPCVWCAYLDTDGHCCLRFRNRVGSRRVWMPKSTDEGWHLQ